MATCPAYHMKQTMEWDAIRAGIDQMFPVKPEPEPQPERIKVFEIDDDYNENFLFTVDKKEGWADFVQNYVDENDAYLKAVGSETEVRYFYTESETQAGCTRCGSITCAGVVSTGIMCNGKQD